MSEVRPQAEEKKNESINLKSTNQPSDSYTKKILIVEDNPINRQILSKILEDDYVVFEAENGQVGLDILEDHWEDISLILLDLIMPVLDGYGFLAAVKDHPQFSTIPIIVTTSNDSEKDEVQALASGATDFIRKPYHWQIVKHRIKSIITLRETAAMFNFIKYDQLTGLYSKEYFYKVAAEEIERNPDKKYDIICCDIEDFSMINDTLGYDFGNEVLRECGNVLRTSLTGNLFCTRMDSDIFVILMPHQECYEESFFQETIDRINELVGRGKIILDFGIYSDVEKDISIYTACNRALSVIEKVKGQFTKNIAYYDDEFRKSKIFNQRITANMEQALKDREFVVYYQPKFNLQTNKMVGAEALVRWISPTEGFMNPGAFIPLFEKNGFISVLDLFVWEEVCIFLRKAMDEGLPTLPISVNISRSDLYALDVPAVVTSLIKKYDLDPAQLHLEITESAYTDQPDMILNITNKLHDLGFILEMDDFGTGYSSLNMLSEMTLDTLKLDMRFAQKSMENDKQNDILAVIFDLAKRMNLDVISEGVESKEQADSLRDMGCDLAQGYYFAKPITSTEYKDLLIDLGKE